MLVLTRKIGESIVIADNIKITVVAIGNGRVKIGIEAPNGISVDREEIHERKMAAGLMPEPELVGVVNRIVDKLPAPAGIADDDNSFRRKPR